MDICEMIDVASNGEDTEEKSCTAVAVGTTEDHVRVCERHAESMAAEGFEVTRDAR